MRVRMPAFVATGALCLLVGYGAIPTIGAEFVDKRTGTVTISVDVPVVEQPPAEQTSATPEILPIPPVESENKSEEKVDTTPEPVPTIEAPSSAPTAEVTPVPTEESTTAATPMSELVEDKEASDETES